MNGCLTTVLTGAQFASGLMLGASEAHRQQELLPIDVLDTAGPPHHLAKPVVGDIQPDAVEMEPAIGPREVAAIRQDAAPLEPPQPSGAGMPNGARIHDYLVFVIYLPFWRGSADPRDAVGWSSAHRPLCLRAIQPSNGRPDSMRSDVRPSEFMPSMLHRRGALDHVGVLTCYMRNDDVADLAPTASAVHSAAPTLWHTVIPPSDGAARH